ncbi:MAG: 50S ribosomal protein L11 methyltransferase [Coleofasciculaceae cyanobacterium RL_1_1]|nr:50S ribosomal protein L11 methyltransferase [Coleofasciculaceae cyanobacterium RL_1_1]
MTNSWWEIQIVADASLEETIFWRLEEFGCKGMASERQEDSILINAYLPQLTSQMLDLATLSLWLRQDAIACERPIPSVRWSPIEEEDWSKSWKDHWQVSDVGDRLVIVPAWLKAPENSDRIPLILDPGVAFGTGAHATTQLCLEALEMRVTPDKPSVLADIGCGSGILSIAAILLGAEQVYAVDTDPLAITATERSQAANHVAPDSIISGVGSVERAIELSQSRPVDGILCNILAEIIVDLIPKMELMIGPNTWGIFSGILLEQAKAMADVLEQNGWVVATLWKRGEWCCFNVRRS